MMLNYYGRDETYEEFLAPIAAAVRYLRSLPGVDTVILLGHSSGGDELTFYQDVAENGPKGCQGPNRIYPCGGKNLHDLPKADGMLLLEVFIGAPERALGVDPAVNNEYPNVRVRELDMFDARNGFDPKTHSGRYSPAFVRRFYAAQQLRNQRLLDDALARLAKIRREQGKFRDDEPFTVAGGSEAINGARLDLADRSLLSHTRYPHPLLEADGASVIEIIPSLLGGVATADDLDELYETAQYVTVRQYLSFYALRTYPDFGATADSINGIDWRSSSDSAVGNVEGITVPTLVMAGTCAAHLVTNEIVYEHSAAKDKQFVGVEGANHFFNPCKPKYGDTVKRTFNYVDAWLTKSDRFADH
jgi:pimeloyl-ACP methyl ester carboxylesterase